LKNTCFKIKNFFWLTRKKVFILFSFTYKMASEFFSFADHGDVKRSLLTVGAVGVLMWLNTEGEKKKSAPAQQKQEEPAFPVQLSKSGFSLKTQQRILVLGGSDAERWFELGMLIKSQGKWSTEERNKNKIKEERGKLFATVGAITFAASHVLFPRESYITTAREVIAAGTVAVALYFWLRIWGRKRNVYNGAANRWKALETSVVNTLERAEDANEERLSMARREAAEIFNQQNSDWDATRK
jgi:hypothetical protein